MKELIINDWFDIMHDIGEDYEIGVDSYGWLKIYNSKTREKVAEINTYRNSPDKICKILKLYKYNVVFKSE